MYWTGRQYPPGPPGLLTMAKAEVNCVRCGVKILKEIGEINRSIRLGRKFFCGGSCAAISGNSSKKSQDIILTCPCGKQVSTTTRKRAIRHCSRSCASKFSMNEGRRSAQSRVGKLSSNLISVVESLKVRECWKYSALENILRDRSHEFEFELSGFIFDLVLYDTHTIVEFDGPYHCGKKQIEQDRIKESVANDFGYTVIRRDVQRATVIDPTTIEGL